MFLEYPVLDYCCDPSRSTEAVQGKLFEDLTERKLYTTEVFKGDKRLHTL